MHHPSNKLSRSGYKSTAPSLRLICQLVTGHLSEVSGHAGVTVGHGGSLRSAPDVKVCLTIPSSHADGDGFSGQALAASGLRRYVCLFAGVFVVFETAKG